MNEHPFDRVVHALRDRGIRIIPKRDSQGRDSVRARCPAHEDRNPSLVVTREGPNVLLHCFGGCTPGHGVQRVQKVAEALGLKAADLFSGPRQPSARPHIIATYDYVDLAGATIAQKVRMSNKRFWWRHPEPDAPGGWDKGVDGRAVGLYCWPDLINARTVYLTEGEKSCDRLWTEGLPTTCGPGGAEHWTEQWSKDLWACGCRWLVIFADHDQAGVQHAELVARITYALAVEEPITLKVVRFLDLPPKADVHDYLSSHTVADLQALINATPLWHPDQLALDRKERRRRQQREWVARRRFNIRMSTGGILNIRTSTDSGFVDRRTSFVDSRRVDTPNVLLGTSQTSVSRDLANYPEAERNTGQSHPQPSQEHRLVEARHPDGPDPAAPMSARVARFAQRLSEASAAARPSPRTGG